MDEVPRKAQRSLNVSSPKSRSFPTARGKTDRVFMDDFYFFSVQEAEAVANSHYQYITVQQLNESSQTGETAAKICLKICVRVSVCSETSAYK